MRRCWHPALAGARENRPKQFLPLFGALSTFQDTVRRVADPALFARPIVVTNGQYRFLVAEQLAAIGAEADILLERHGAIPGRPLPPAPVTPWRARTAP